MDLYKQIRPIYNSLYYSGLIFDFCKSTSRARLTPGKHVQSDLRDGADFSMTQDSQPSHNTRISAKRGSSRTALCARVYEVFNITLCVLLWFRTLSFIASFWIGVDINYPTDITTIKLTWLVWWLQCSLNATIALHGSRPGGCLEQFVMTWSALSPDDNTPKPTPRRQDHPEEEAKVTREPNAPDKSRSETPFAESSIRYRTKAERGVRQRELDKHVQVSTGHGSGVQEQTDGTTLSVPPAGVWTTHCRQKHEDTPSSVQNATSCQNEDKSCLPWEQGEKAQRSNYSTTNGAETTTRTLPDHFVENVQGPIATKSRDDLLQTVEELTPRHNEGFMGSPIVPDLATHFFNPWKWTSIKDDQAGILGHHGSADGRPQAAEPILHVIPALGRPVERTAFPQTDEEGTFEKTSRKLAGIFWLVIAGNMVFIITNLFTSLFPEAETLVICMTSPFGHSMTLKILITITISLGACAWMLPACLCYAIFTMLRMRFRQLTGRITQQISRERRGFPTGLEQARQEHVRLCQCVRVLDQIVGKLLMTSYATNLPLTVILFYIIISGHVALTQLVIYVFWTVANVGNCLLISLLAAQVHEAAHSPLDALFFVPAEQGTVEQLTQLFVAQLSGPPICFTALGTIAVTKETVLSVVGLLITYFLVLREFNR